MRRTLLTILLAATLALAGCLGGSDGGANVDTQGTDAANDTPKGTAGNGTVNATAEPTHAWNSTTEEGTLRGGSAVVFVYSDPRGSDSTQNWTVAEGALNLTVNLTTGGDQVYFTIYPPGCDGSFAQSSDCEINNNTEGGTIHVASDPKPGTWSITMFRNEPGYGTTDYALTTAILEPLQG